MEQMVRMSKDADTDEFGHKWVRIDPTNYQPNPKLGTVTNINLDHATLAGDVAEAAIVPFADLPILDAAKTALEAADRIRASILEMQERLTECALTPADRADIARDLYEDAAKLSTFALTVFA